MVLLHIVDCLINYYLDTSLLKWISVDAVQAYITSDSVVS